MKNIRREILEMSALGPFPSEEGAEPARVLEYERLYRKIHRPITDDEARVLIRLLGEDGYFGLASALMHLIETAPGWPLKDCLSDSDNEWVATLRSRALKSGYKL